MWSWAALLEANALWDDAEAAAFLPGERSLGMVDMVVRGVVEVCICVCVCVCVCGGVLSLLSAKQRADWVRGCLCVGVCECVSV